MKGFRKLSSILEMLLLLYISVQFILPAGSSSTEMKFNLAEIRSCGAFGCEFAENLVLNNATLILPDQAEPVALTLEVAFPEAPIEVNDGNINEMIEIYSPLVIDCWKIACSPCKSMDLTIDKLAADYRGRIAFGKLCINRNAAAAKKYGLYRAPTLLIFNNGTLVYKHVGNYPRERLEEIILTALRMR